MKSIQIHDDDDAANDDNNNKHMPVTQFIN